MQVIVALLRGVNVGGSNQIRMEKLRAICGSMGLEDSVTLLQSGNVAFRTRETDLAEIAAELEGAIRKECGFETLAVLRTIPDLRAVIEANPFSGREGLNPSRLMVSFLRSDPGDDARQRAREVDAAPEEIHAVGRELYTYYRDGLGQTKLKDRVVSKAIGCQGTARNWNTVAKLLELAEELAGKA